MWIPNQQLKLKMRVKKEKTFRIKTNNQELLIRKQNESDATSWWIKFQKTNLQQIQDWFTRDFQSYSKLKKRSQTKLLLTRSNSLVSHYLSSTAISSRIEFQLLHQQNSLFQSSAILISKRFLAYSPTNSYSIKHLWNPFHFGK